MEDTLGVPPPPPRASPLLLPLRDTVSVGDGEVERVRVMEGVGEGTVELDVLRVVT